MAGVLKWTFTLTALWSLAVLVGALNIASSNLANAYLSESTDTIVETVMSYDIMLLQVRYIGRAFLFRLEMAFRARDVPFKIIIDRENNTIARQRNVFVYRTDRVSLVNHHDHESDQPSPSFSATFSPVGQGNLLFTLLAAKIRRDHQAEDIQEVNKAISRIQAVYGPDHAIAVFGTLFIYSHITAFRHFSSRRLSKTFMPFGVYNFGNMVGAVDPNHGSRKEAKWDSDRKKILERVITITEFKIDVNRLNIMPHLDVSQEDEGLQLGTSTANDPRASATSHVYTVSSAFQQHAGSSVHLGSYNSRPTTSSFPHGPITHGLRPPYPGVQPLIRPIVQSAAPVGFSRTRHASAGIDSRFTPYRINDGRERAAGTRPTFDQILQSTDLSAETSSNPQHRGQLQSLRHEMVDRRLDGRCAPVQPYTDHHTVYRRHQQDLRVVDPVVIPAQSAGREQHKDGNIHDDTRLLTDFHEWAQSQPDSFLTSLLERDIVQLQHPTRISIQTVREHMSGGHVYQRSPNYANPSFSQSSSSASQRPVQDSIGAAIRRHQYPAVNDDVVLYYPQLAEYVD